MFLRATLLFFLTLFTFASLNNREATAAWQTQTVDSAGDVGEYTSLAFDTSGNPAISYSDSINGDLKFARALNGDGDFADAGEIITVDSAGSVGMYTSLAFDASGNPAISYTGSINGDFKFARVEPEDCTNGIDDDVDGLVDCDDPDCADTRPCGGEPRIIPTVTPNGSVIYSFLLMAAGIFYMLWRRRR